MPDQITNQKPAVTAETIQEAANRIANEAVRTPLINHPVLDQRSGAKIYLKPECLQRTGSFKFRGALNAISQLSTAEKANGIVAYSSGNHAQGVAAAAHLCGVAAIIAMPADAPQIKRQATARWGARIVEFDRSDPDGRDKIAAQLLAETGGSLIHPYDDLRIIAGQGTVGYEIAADLKAMGERPDCVLVPCGGGGLTAGVAIAVQAQFPDADIYTVEPERFDDTAQSFAAGERRSVAVDQPSLCDSLLVSTPGALTFAINRARVKAGLVIDDPAACDAVHFAFEHLKLVLEPGGAAALAAVLQGKLNLQGKTAVVVGSGGNVDPAVYATILNNGS